MSEMLGRQSVSFDSAYISAHACVGGKAEGKGPLGDSFDIISNDAYFGEGSWEKAESRMVRLCFDKLLEKAGLSAAGLDRLLCGDLLNQCSGTTYALSGTGVPQLGLYGACSTCAEALALGAMLADGGSASTVCAITGSHFCSAEKQFRLPLEYGGQRPPSSQWTATAAGGFIIRRTRSAVRITHATVGFVHDTGLTDANSMGAAMAPAAYLTLKAHFAETGRTASSYDAIYTGDLGFIGQEILIRLMRGDGLDLTENYADCGTLIYDRAVQDVHSGGSGCGCSASVLACHILPMLESGQLRRVLFAATGALHSPSALQQGRSIPGICHAVALEAVE